MNWALLLAACAIIVTIILFVLKQFFDWKKELENRIRILENNNIENKKDIEYLQKENLHPFQKGEKEK